MRKIKFYSESMGNSKEAIQDFLDFIEGKMKVVYQLNIESAGITAVTVDNHDFSRTNDVVKIGEELYNFRDVAHIKYQNGATGQQDTFVIDYTEDELLDLYVEFI